MLFTSAEHIASDLLQYGEDATAAWVLRCTDAELVRTRRRGQPTWTTHQDEDGVWHLGRLPDAALAARVTADHGVGADARAVWQAR